MKNSLQAHRLPPTKQPPLIALHSNGGLIVHALLGKTILLAERVGTSLAQNDNTLSGKQRGGRKHRRSFVDVIKVHRLATCPRCLTRSLTERVFSEYISLFVEMCGSGRWKDGGWRDGVGPVGWGVFEYGHVWLMVGKPGGFVCGQTGCGLHGNGDVL